MLPDAVTLTPTLQDQLLLSKRLWKQAQWATALPALKRLPLMSLGKLCDDNCTVILDKSKMLTIKEIEIVLQRRRNSLDTYFTQYNHA